MLSDLLIATLSYHLLAFTILTTCEEKGRELKKGRGRGRKRKNGNKKGKRKIFEAILNIC